ncbi:DEAD/DEAH box helicase [Rhizobium sp. SSA_523]|uniref:DEAD/DEAH box helicase n=1 Tax=Rhizobium sp. SSA_523 TaxID=2952477 RepID=UPI0020908731|nr:DEAD/DEAH box helicase [Rhizobium sp. SSA_523]MCO5733137.1 DEAD/DEAH box helicase [Rhizobium sp. SSA_523]WKC24011.1 helicase-related protein [Rhizobium sp. SSA_523]
MKWQVHVSVVEYEAEQVTKPRAAEERPTPEKPPAGLVATRLAALLKLSGRSQCYVALSDGAADEIAAALLALFPHIPCLVLPPWDCLPYDRVPPSRHCMGRRMDALRIWNGGRGEPKLLITSLEAVLQRVPPASVIQHAKLDLVVGEAFDREAFAAFVRQTGYIEEGVADDPGEVVVREGVIDIYPAGAPGPMRIVLSKEDRVQELRGFDRVSQRTESFLDRVTLGPASEAVRGEDPDEALDSDSDGDSDNVGDSDRMARKSTPEPNASCTMETELCRLYDAMPAVFEVLGEAPVHIAQGADERVTRYFDIIEDARQSRESLGESETSAARSLYLTPDDFTSYASRSPAEPLDLGTGGRLPVEASQMGGARKALAAFVQTGLQQKRKFVLAGRGRSLEALCRRLAQATGQSITSADSWDAVLAAEEASLVKLPCDLEQGFIDAENRIAVLAAAGEASALPTSSTLLAEPELRIGDVVVHEDHGVGVLRDLESIEIEGVAHDAARLEYRDGGSILVPMDEFGRLWRYGSEAEAVSLDRLHTEAWQKKREKIAKDIQATARHLAAIARQRQASRAEIFVPPRAAFSAFARRFPYAETPDQAEAIRAVLADLASGQAMNRLICGDVGFGKTEIALRAAAAVALAGGQVVVIAPTTVLARQHLATFEHRFAGTGISVGMLSRLVKPAKAQEVKAALADGGLRVVVATQAILAKSIEFESLGLLIVDEEHRFGLKEKQAMSALAPALHMLAMSATPIPRTMQSAMIGVQEVSLLTTPPTKRRPVRTSLAAFDSASLRTGLMREYRRGGQSFVVVPRIEDMDEVEAILRKVVPELSVRLAHGKMPAAAIDEAIVAFAEGDGDVLLATNIIENGLDVPRANTMFVWRAELFGLAQLHQLRGRVGRAAAQGMAVFLTPEGNELSEDTRLRLSTLVENDRLGSGLAIALRDLDLRGGGDLAGENQAGHIRAIGIGLYQKLLASAVAKLRRQAGPTASRAVLNLGVAGSIPADYISDPAVRLNLYARLLRAAALSEMDDLEDEFEDRFGEPPQEVLLLLRTTRLQLAAARLGFAKLEAGPKALAITLSKAAPAKIIAALTKTEGANRREDRLVFATERLAGETPLDFFERIVTPSKPG